MTSELVLIRHGLANCNLRGLIGGDRGCTGLAAQGAVQSGRLARRIRVEHANGLPVASVHASPRRRTLETARFVADSLHLPVQIEPAFSDVELGPELDGTRWSDLRSRLSLTADQFPADRVHPQAEIWADHLSRIEQGLKRLTAIPVDGRMIVVAHRETVAAALEILSGMSGAAASTVAMGHTALTVWRRVAPTGGAASQLDWRLEGHNDQAHLAPPSLP